VTAVAGQQGEVCLSSYVYNGNGVRTRREGNWGRTWDYVWDVAAGLPVILNEMNRLYELDGATAVGSVNNTYVYGLDLISVTDKDGNQSYFLYDGLGSTTNLTDGSGNVTTTYGYDVFGATRSQSGTPDTVFRFTGEQRDIESGLYYLRARFYEPAIGRFLSQDPLPGGNLYAYVGNNPTNRVDPTGLMWVSSILGGVTNKEGGNFAPGTTCRGNDYECLRRLARPAPTPPCEAALGATCCYTPQEPNGFVCGPQVDGLGLGGLLDVLQDIGESIIGCEACARIAHGVVTYVQCTGDPRVLTTAAYAIGATGQPYAGVAVVGGGCVAVVVVTETTHVNPLHP
jgi:RHS repeat-associated protein